jgi:predicted GNAT family N-acyltransferase
MLEGSTEVVAAIEREPDGSCRLVGFTRALSDGAFRAIVFDVVVGKAHRSGGLNVRLLRELLNRPSIVACRRVDLLSRPELVPFYERFGFEVVSGSAVRMERHGR